MSVKQDRQGVRTAKDLEQKYQFGKQFAELMGIAMDARESVDSLASTLRSEMLEQSTSITRDVAAIRLEAQESYALKTDVDEVEAEAKSSLEQTAKDITFSFDEKVKAVKDGVEAINTDLSMHFEFSANGLTIKAGDNTIRLRLTNGVIAFYNGEIDEEKPEQNRLGWWDGDYFRTGSIRVDVNERAQFGNFAFLPRTNGSLDFLKVGGE